MDNPFDFETPPRGIALRKRLPPKTVKPFTTDDELLEAGAQLFRARRAMMDAETDAGCSADRLKEIQAEENAWTRYWHQSFQRSNGTVRVVKICKRHRLNQAEREMLTALILDHLGLLETKIKTNRDLVTLLSNGKTKMLDVLRMVSENGRLVTLRLVRIEDLDESLADRRPLVDLDLIDSIIGKKDGVSGWPVNEEHELYRCLKTLTGALARKSQWMDAATEPYASRNADISKYLRLTNHLMSRLQQTLIEHPNWKLNAILKGLHPSEDIIFLALLGKQLGHGSGKLELFTGGGLARAAAEDFDMVDCMYFLLQPHGNLIKAGLVQQCDGEAEFASDAKSDLEEAEFELTAKAISLLGLDAKDGPKFSSSVFCSRPGLVRMENLVLSEKMKRSLEAAIVLSRSRRRLLDEWGLGEVAPYGSGSILLFAGPPGTGKTATAEALANELGRPILVVDYSRIESSYVGQTEKNIARAFAEAEKQNAVLFWDEADGMFYDRDSAQRTWEIRHVNVLLQAIERFTGVCILATNRKVALDKALERRIAMKIEFPRPDQSQRRAIWEKFLPKKMPIGQDVDLDELSDLDLSGGEIKNIVFNAAALALNRDEHGSVGMTDFRKALALEKEGRWSKKESARIGFEMNIQS